MKTSQSFPFYPTDFLMGTALLSGAEVGAYIRLLCYQWQEGQLPNDQNLLARLAQTDEGIIAGIIHKFAVCSDGQLRNRKMEDVRKALNLYKKSRQENGRKGGRPKKHMVSSRLASEKHTESLPSPIPLPFPSPISVGVPPTDSRHREIMQSWGERFQTINEREYVCDGGRDGKALKTFLGLSKVTSSDFLTIAEAAWRRATESAFVAKCKEAFTIHGLCQFWNEINAEIKRPSANGSSTTTSTAVRDRQ